MKGRSAQEKGKSFERWVAKQVEEFGLGKSAREIGSGQGRYKGDIRTNIPFLLECKAHQKLNIWESARQAKEQARVGNADPDKWALIIREPGSPKENPTAYAVIDLHEFLKLLKKDSEPLTKEPDRELKYRLRTLAQAAKQVEKYLPD